MRALFAFPIPVDSATAAWAGPVFGVMAIASVAVLIAQTVRYFRDNRGGDGGDGNADGDRGDGSGDDSATR
jgi:hypothetical protein